MPVVVMSCNCDSEFQDERYGRWLRVHSVLKPDTGGPRVRCSVCGVVKHTAPKAEPVKKRQSPQRAAKAERKAARRQRERGKEVGMKG